MIENIKNEFKIMLTEYDWMDAKSKQAAAEKVFLARLSIDKD